MSLRTRSRLPQAGLQWLLLVLALLGGLQRGLLPATQAGLTVQGAGVHMLCHHEQSQPSTPHPPADCDDSCCRCVGSLPVALPGGALPCPALRDNPQVLRTTTAPPLNTARWRYREPPGQAPPAFFV